MMLVGMMLTAFVASAQTFVSTQPGKRNALIEEYTGVNCQYCPLGHKATDQTVEAFPGRVFAIIIHQGTFASRFTTQWGNALAGQASISGYPSSTLSRHAFFGNSIHIDPGQAYSCAAEILEMDAPVNVAATVDIDPQSRLMVVKVEAYYTADANGGTNMLNVALVQNNVLYYQAGASSYYPENMVNGEYQHKHILRDLLTGQWGDTIHQTTAGSFFTKEYAYVIPQQIGDLEVPNVDDLSVVVFVCEGRKEVLNACEAIRTGDKAYIACGHAGGEECSLEWNPFVTVINPTDQPIDNLKFNVEGSVVTRNKTIAPYCSDTVRIAHFAIDAMPEASQSYSQSVSVAFSGFASNGHEVAAAGDPVGISYGLLSADQLGYTRQGGRQQVWLSTCDTLDIPWTATAGADWITLSDTDFDRLGQVSIDVEENNTGAERTATVTFTQGSHTAILTVVQEAYDPASDYCPLTVLMENTHNEPWAGDAHLSFESLSGTVYGTAQHTANSGSSSTTVSVAPHDVMVRWHPGGARDRYINYKVQNQYGETLVEVDNAYFDGADVLLPWPCARVGIDDVVASAYSIWPNPATDRVSVASSGGRPFTLALLDVAGRVLFQSNGSSLDLGAVAQGVYYLRIVSDGNVHVRKLIKQ